MDARYPEPHSTQSSPLVPFVDSYRSSWMGMLRAGHAAGGALVVAPRIQHRHGVGSLLPWRVLGSRRRGRSEWLHFRPASWCRRRPRRRGGRCRSGRAPAVRLAAWSEDSPGMRVSVASPRASASREVGDEALGARSPACRRWPGREGGAVPQIDSPIRRLTRSRSWPAWAPWPPAGRRPWVRSARLDRAHLRVVGGVAVRRLEELLDVGRFVQVSAGLGCSAVGRPWSCRRWWRSRSRRSRVAGRPARRAELAGEAARSGTGCG